MKGCVFKRKLPSGKVTWGYSLDHGKGADGKRKQQFKSGFSFQREAADALKKLLKEKDADDLVRPDPTVFEVFIEDWFREHAARQCTPKTVERYRQLVDYVVPYIGKIKLQDLSALSLERIFNHLKDRGGRDRKTKKARPLAAKTVHHIAGVVNGIMVTALRWKVIKSNPMATVVLPKIAKKEARALDPSQVCWYLDAARARGLYEFLMIDSATGCRRGELLALTWKDVSFPSRVLTISKSLEQTKAGLRIKPTKSEKPRPISIPQSAVEILKMIQSGQERNRQMFGADYRRDLDLVFCSPDGNYLKPDSISSKCSLIAKKAGLKNVSLHTLRHSHTSLLLSLGVPLPVVSKRLGHSSPHFTAKVYSHALPTDEETAAEKWESAFQKNAAAERNVKIS